MMNKTIKVESNEAEETKIDKGLTNAKKKNWNGERQRRQPGVSSPRSQLIQHESCTTTARFINEDYSLQLSVGL